jgi:hypothetical protein
MTRRWIILAFLSLPASAAPPPGTDMSSPVAQWFARQHNVRGGWCCDLGDGHILEPDDWRSDGKHYEVRIHGRWITITDDQLRDTNGGPNPTGAAIVWFTVNDEYGIQVYCFAPGAEL